MLTRKEFLSLILNLLIGGFCFSQTKVITIEKKFEDIVELEEIGTIYLTEIEAGFTLQILSVSGITKAQLMGTSEFTDASMNTRVEVQGGYRYVDLKPKSVGGNFEVKVFKGKESHIVKVKVLEYIKFVSTKMDLNELKSPSSGAPKSKKENAKTVEEILFVPADLNVNLNVNIAQVLYDNIVLKNMGGGISINDETATFKDVTASLLGGSTVINGYYSTKNHGIPDIK